MVNLREIGYEMSQHKEEEMGWLSENRSHPSNTEILIQGIKYIQQRRMVPYKLKAKTGQSNIDKVEKTE